MHIDPQHVDLFQGRNACLAGLGWDPYGAYACNKAACGLKAYSNGKVSRCSEERRRANAGQLQTERVERECVGCNFECLPKLNTPRPSRHALPPQLRNPLHFWAIRIARRVNSKGAAISLLPWLGAI